MVQRGREVSEEVRKYCSSCQRDNIETKYHKAEKSNDKTQTCVLCELCYKTFIGNAHQYPGSYPSVTPSMLAQAIWWLHDELNKGPK